MNDEQTEASQAPYDLAQLDELYLQGEISPTQYWSLQRKLLHDATLSQRFNAPPPYLAAYPPPVETHYQDPYYQEESPEGRYYPSAEAYPGPYSSAHLPPHGDIHDLPQSDPYQSSYQDSWYDPYPDRSSYQETQRSPIPSDYQERYPDPWHEPLQDHQRFQDPPDLYHQTYSDPWEEEQPRYPDLNSTDSYADHVTRPEAFAPKTDYFDHEHHGFLPPAPFPLPEEPIEHAPQLLPGLGREPVYSPPPVMESPATRATRRAARGGEAPTRATRRERRTSATESVYAPAMGAVDLFDTEVPQGGLRRHRRKKRPWWWWLWPFGRH
ncbi:hypothetical protein [Austwickia chelonae]|uniref:hypothetical protein n=1 Tax=Austwickia chelonae TaxID=100225 RepID=UPI000E264890|nr:hypothetical protein [Austwickia chelonae]